MNLANIRDADPVMLQLTWGKNVWQSSDAGGLADRGGRNHSGV